MPHEQTEHVVNGARYRLTHELTEDGEHTGRGTVQVQVEIKRPDGLFEKQFQQTGASYQGFVAQMKAKAEAERRALEEENADREFEGEPLEPVPDLPPAVELFQVPPEPVPVFEAPGEPEGLPEPEPESFPDAPAPLEHFGLLELEPVADVPEPEPEVKREPIPDPVFGKGKKKGS